MRVWFLIKYRDWFGEMYEEHVWAQSSEDAIRIFEKKHEYYYEIVDAYIDWHKLEQDWNEMRMWGTWL